MLHDWESKETKYTNEDLTRGKSEKDGFAKKISLKDEWKYYLWDPSYTKKKKGKLKTKDGKDLPFNIQIGKFVTTKLLK
ncbi:hypothetical protein WEN_00140 [Mycoplasma wenyonii str. Massachusetts]|uniref:Uncharacterized protein n=1 Tax=Mycoplasma wenyonii (strain Massachusetts) TaxID=1197325 RepID=I6ZE61_MYCWM|nr:hypothetical protein [Mycoplasma wenyonii]AFN64837.1 hypothetical protein WEN_00140 [Mycoplasma wenyonii str. Massachusetts]